MKYELEKYLFKILKETHEGTFYMKGTSEYNFQKFIINEEFLDDKQISYPHLTLSGSSDYGEIILDLFPLGLMKKKIESEGNILNCLEGRLTIVNGHERYNSEGKITDYWNGIFWIDKNTIRTNIENYKEKGIFLFS